MPALPSPSFHFASQASLLKYQATAAGGFVATLDSLQGVNQVEWSVVKTDDTTAPGDYTLVTSGSRGEVCSGTAGAAGTALILQCRVNAGVNPVTGAVDDTMTATAKVWVPCVGAGFEVGCWDEGYESGAKGWLPQHNAAIRGASSVIALSSPVVAPTPDTVPLRDGTGKLKGIGYDAGGAVVSAVANPVAATDAANKQWVEAYMGKYLPRIEVVGGQTVSWDTLLYEPTVAVGLDSVILYPGGVQAAKADYWQVAISRIRGGVPTTLVPLTNLNTAGSDWSTPMGFLGLAESSLPGDQVFLYYVRTGAGVDPLIPHSVVWKPA